ncbi:coiled-coil domain-containing protein 130 homolog [Chelonus insularis]|uniref:coiled-coil domain-containing protein 130 homolog n=1 Tax=Chelonus insularis TaxID=460826 RepID=UPI00158BFDEA|nr:coiled-coil domain-containing protein 130 homolog [Chelonus insularis]
MGERKGTNLYYPPDYDPRVGGLNKFMGTHALRERARKLPQGILIIRFEMPFNIWCNGCNNHIGMGVRYNAEKKKIGMYYSTPLYQFRMKCHLCDNHFEIKTDPANLTYIIESGARRQENRWDPTENEQVVPEDKEVSKRLYDDAMFKLEHSIGDKKKSKSQDPSLNRLIEKNHSQWSDDYSLNSTLRASFRTKKKEAQEQRKSLLAKNLSSSIELVDEHDDDVKLARIIMKNKSNDSAKKSGKAASLKRLIRVSQAQKIKKPTTSTFTKAVVKTPKNATSSTETSSGSKSNSIASLVNYDSSSSDSNT